MRIKKLKKTYISYLEKKNNNIIKIRNRSNNTKMNLIKAYAMIAVVCSHCKGGGIAFPLNNWVSPTFYFMPLFVFVSGFFYREENDNTSYRSFLTSKIRTLVIPYFLWNLVYGILNLIFRELGIINYGVPINAYSFFVRPWIDGHQYHFNIASWFLLSLFIDTIAIFTIRKLLKKLHLLNDIALLQLLLVFL